MSKQIFISQAVANKPIADAISDLLAHMGVNVGTDVFCSSLEGLGIPTGKNFKDFIHEQIQDPKFVFLIITKNYLESAFCLAEVGASWALSHRIVPIIVPPATFDDMKAVLQGTQAYVINDKFAWNEVHNFVTAELGISPNLNRWERKRDEFLEKIEGLIADQPKPSSVSWTEYKASEKKLKEANKEILELETALNNQNNLVEKLKGLKDAAEVDDAVYESMGEMEQLEYLAGQAKSKLGRTHYGAREAIYYYTRNEDYSWPSGYGTGGKLQDVKDAFAANELVEQIENLIPNREEPIVEEALNSLDDLEDFVSKADADFKRQYVKKFGHALEFKSSKFWDTWLR